MKPVQTVIMKFPEILILFKTMKFLGNVIGLPPQPLCYEIFKNVDKNCLDRFHENSSEFHIKKNTVRMSCMKTRGASTPNEEPGDDGGPPNENSGKFHSSGTFHNNGGRSTGANETTEIRFVEIT